LENSTFKNNNKEFMMDKLSKLKAIALLVCSGLTGIAFAEDAPPPQTPATATTNTTDTAATQPNNDKLAADVTTALSGYTNGVTVSAKGDIVYLAGQVLSDTDYETVVMLSQSTPGVTDVNVDKLTIKDSANPLYDAYITAKVKGALIQSGLMGKDTSTWPIQITTKDSSVYLSGTMGTDKEKEAVLGVINKVQGVTEVADKITLSTPATPDTNDTTTTPIDADQGDNSTNDSNAPTNNGSDSNSNDNNAPDSST
jgi:hyperosmotically inducible protein